MNAGPDGSISAIGKAPGGKGRTQSFWLGGVARNDLITWNPRVLEDSKKDIGRSKDQNIVTWDRNFGSLKAYRILQGTWMLENRLLVLGGF